MKSPKLPKSRFTKSDFEKCLFTKEERLLLLDHMAYLDEVEYQRFHDLDCHWEEED